MEEVISTMFLFLMMIMMMAMITRCDEHVEAYKINRENIHLQLEINHYVLVSRTFLSIC
jgi:hypothetical protein